MMDLFDLALIASRRGDYPSAHLMLQALVDEENDPRAMSALALFARKGLGEPVDLAKSAALLARGAALGDADCAYDLGVHHANGWGVDADPTQALAWYRTAAERGHLRGNLMAGIMAFRGEGMARDLDDAERRLRANAARDDGSAKMCLGDLFAAQTERRDPIEAAHWYIETGAESVVERLTALRPELESLAAAGNRRAAHVLAAALVEYLDDPAAAAALLEPPTDPVAERMLGALLVAGRGVAQDRDRGRKLLASAATAADPVACLHHGLLVAADGDHVNAAILLRTAAEHGATAAWAPLARSLAAQGLGPEARDAARKAAEHGDRNAQLALATWCRRGTHGPVDLARRRAGTSRCSRRAMPMRYS
ncbi:MAG: sel1 repeat family protein, partial [Kofleriaceae bacterium]|nr:sel1 repeat family protein [Kofleriaceae bacterium]